MLLALDIKQWEQKKYKTYILSLGSTETSTEVQ